MALAGALLVAALARPAAAQSPSAYDPIADPAVREAFETLYAADAMRSAARDIRQRAETNYDPWDYWDPETLQHWADHPDAADIIVLRRALERQHTSVDPRVCRIVRSSACNVWHRWEDCSDRPGAECTPGWVWASAGGAWNCRVAGEMRFNRSNHFIGPDFMSAWQKSPFAGRHDYPETLTLEAQMENFFALECVDAKPTATEQP